ncbi:IS66 family insertion sequence element accessory protein TnpB [Microbulbifer sp. 2205BS26-8]|uniref:IS66 family insertion sequence element accessory protein TnpA n=1 Tax=Microbulbifer sp. 2205BS26-8 TaxID=3064386 RepID=UPI00273D8A55|nr:IS66 family insertion sequence element accessory protein TnpB [Microbulbifer sp. 2205BS26-8]MDP5210707.1 IS66 family insertion sequence element accessory protein TnpB [Microbulbifer sp. 2205BS26-8]
MSSTDNHTLRPRRSAQQWQALIEKWQASATSAKQFCSEQAIGYASFCQWRKRLSAPDKNTRQDGNMASGFIDLAALSSGASPGWEIVLSLGNGVELKLSQR